MSTTKPEPYEPVASLRCVFFFNRKLSSSYEQPTCKSYIIISTENHCFPFFPKQHHYFTLFATDLPHKHSQHPATRRGEGSFAKALLIEAADGTQAVCKAAQGPEDAGMGRSGLRGRGQEDGKREILCRW